MSDAVALKRCCSCHELKPVNEFNRRKRSRDGLQTICRDCSNVRSRRYYAENQEAHAQAVTERNRKWKVELRQRILEYLSEHCCVDCGCTDVRVLEFDHQGDKEYAIAQMIGAANSWERIQREIAKCEVRCANCHRIRSFEDRPSYRSIGYLKINAALILAGSPDPDASMAGSSDRSATYDAETP